MYSNTLNTTFNPALGQFVTLTVDYSALVINSPLFQNATYSSLVAGWQLEVATLSDQGNPISAFANGAVTGTVGDTFDFAVINSSDYSRMALDSGTIIDPPVLALDSTPTEVNSQIQNNSVVSTPAVIPTVANTQVKWDDDLGPAATVNNVVGNHPYTISYTFPRTTQKKFSNAGYPLYHEVDAESVTSGNVPYLPIPGQTFVDLVNPVTSAGSLGENYTGSPASTGDQWVYDTNLTGDMSVTVSVDAQGLVTLSRAPTILSSFEYYRIDSDGTVDVINTFIVSATGIIMPTSINTLIRNARLDTIPAAIDAGAGAGQIFVYDGVRPASGGAATNLIVSTTYSDPSFPAAVNGQAVANAINDGTVVLAATMTWFRVVDSDGNWVMDGDVVGLGDGLVPSDNPVDVNDTVSFTHTMTEPNA